MSDDPPRWNVCTTRPYLLAVLSRNIDESDPFYRAVVRTVAEVLPALVEDAYYTAEQLLGPDFFGPLSNTERRRAGKYLAYAVSVGRLPLRFAVCVHKHPKLYRLE